MKSIKYFIIAIGLTLMGSVRCFAQNPNWEVDLSEYQFRMSMSSILERFGTDLIEGEHTVAAFVNDEIRGVGYPTSYHEPSDKYLAIFQIGSNTSSGESITFQIYDENQDEIVEARFTVEFEANESVGSVTDPYIISDNQFPRSISISENSFNENLDVGSTPISISTVDGDDNSHTYSILEYNPAEASELLGINENSIEVLKNISFEEISAIRITIETTDELGGTYSTEFDLTINDVAEQPVETTLSGNVVTENTATGTLIGTFTTEDDDFDESFSYSIVSETELFSVQGNELLTSNDIDFESGESYSIEIQTADKDDLTINSTFTITIEDVNEAPTIDDLLISIDENIPLDTIIGTIIAQDQDAGQTLIYSLDSADHLPFLMNSETGEISIDDLVNFEASQDYIIKVDVTDNGTPQLSTSIQIEITINDLNEVPTEISISNQFVEENTGQGTLVGTFFTTDEDFDETFTYELLAIENSLDHNSFSVVDDQLITEEALDKELTEDYTLRIKVTDSGGNEWIEDIVIFIIDLNESPILSDTAFTINENIAVGTEIGQILAIEPDEGQTLTYEIVGSNLPFSMDSATGILTTQETINYEEQSTYSFSIKVVDDGAPAIQNIAKVDISIVDLNEMPTELTLSSNQVFENRSEGSFIGQLFTTDEDQVESFVYQIISVNGIADQNLFTISNSRLFSIEGFNFEEQSSYQVLVQSFDKEALSIQETFTVQVLDVNESPELLDEVYYIDENSENGTEIGEIPFFDEDTGQSYIFSTSESAIDISLSQDGIISVGNSEGLDYEEVKELNLFVTISDNGDPNLSDTLTYQIFINDLPEERLSINNFISPNGDGFNDFLVIQNIEIYEGYTLEVFNSSGVLIYQDDNYDNTWEGTYNGKTIPAGIYFYSFSKSGSTLKYEGELYVKER